MAAHMIEGEAGALLNDDLPHAYLGRDPLTHCLTQKRDSSCILQNVPAARQAFAKLA